LKKEKRKGKGEELRLTGLEVPSGEGTSIITWGEGGSGLLSRGEEGQNCRARSAKEWGHRIEGIPRSCIPSPHFKRRYLSGFIDDVEKEKDSGFFAPKTTKQDVARSDLEGGRGEELAILHNDWEREKREETYRHRRWEEIYRTFSPS